MDLERSWWKSPEDGLRGAGGEPPPFVGCFGVLELRRSLSVKPGAPLSSCLALWDSQASRARGPIALAKNVFAIHGASLGNTARKFRRIRLAEEYLYLLLSAIIYVKNDGVGSGTKPQFVSSEIWFIHPAFHSFIRHVGHSSGHSFICLVVAVIIAYCLGVFPPPLLPLRASSRRWRGRRGR